MEAKVNSQGVPVGKMGYVICTLCGKEVTEISREVSIGYAKCLHHRSTSTKEGGTMTAKKERKPKVKRASGTPQPAIKWFQEVASETQDLDSIREKAKKQKYSDSTISIQIGRLRGMGLLPAKEKQEKGTEATVRAVPKPGAKKRARKQKEEAAPESTVAA